MAKIGEIVSRIKNNLKLSDIDAFMTDRLIYSLLSKHIDAIMLKYSQKFNIFNNNALFYTISYIELQEVSKIPDDCIDIDIGCCNGVLKRSINKIPDIRVVNGKYLVRGIYSIDRQYKFNITTFNKYLSTRKSTYTRYYKEVYAIYENGYIYIPDVDIEAISIEAAFKDNVAAFRCDEVNKCIRNQESDISLPDEYLAEAEAQTKQELIMLYNIPVNPLSINNDNQHPVRK